MSQSAKPTTIQYAATVHRAQLCRDRLLDRFTPSLPTVLETVPIPRPMYWVRRAGPNDLVVTVPPTPPTNGNRPWSLLSGPIHYTHPDMIDMHKRLESAEEDVDEDDARTIVEAWDAVEVGLAKDKVMAFMNETFGSGMAPRTDSGYASTECPSPPRSHAKPGPVACPDTCSADTHTADTRTDSPSPSPSTSESDSAEAATLVRDSSSANASTTATDRKRGFAAKVCRSVKKAVAKVGAAKAPGTRHQSPPPAITLPTDIVRETRAFVLKHASARGATGKRHGNEAAIRSGIVGLLLDSPANFITDKRCETWANLFAAGSGARVCAKPSKQYRDKHASAALTPHILVPYVVGGLLRWVADNHGECAAAGGKVHALMGLDELIQVATGGNGTRTADALAAVDLIKVSGAGLWRVGSVDARPALAAYLVLGLDESGEVMEHALAVLERAFA